MKTLFKKTFILIIVCTVVVCSLVFYAYADTVEVRDGLKTTYADYPRRMIYTSDGIYDLKWVLDRKGNWKLYLKKFNGKNVNISNYWVRVNRTVSNESGNSYVVDDYYYFDYYEKMVTGWYVDTTGDVFFLNTDDNELGRMVRGWHKIGEDYYYFNQDGILQRNTLTSDGFYVDEDGKWK